MYIPFLLIICSSLTVGGLTASASVLADTYTHSRAWSIYFAHESSTISDSEALVIAEVIEAYRKNMPISVRITGYASPDGQRSTNERISAWRARAVLVRLGRHIGYDTLSYEARGEMSISPLCTLSRRCVTIEFQE